MPDTPNRVGERYPTHEENMAWSEGYTAGEVAGRVPAVHRLDDVRERWATAEDRLEAAQAERDRAVEELARTNKERDAWANDQTDKLTDARNTAERAVEALRAVTELAAVSVEGDPWYAEQEGLDAEAILNGARSILQEREPS